jgi:hypothetical protein
MFLLAPYFFSRAARIETQAERNSATHANKEATASCSWGAAKQYQPAEDPSTERGEVMLSQETAAPNYQIQIWPIDRLVFYARNPRDPL